MPEGVARRDLGVLPVVCCGGAALGEGRSIGIALRRRGSSGALLHTESGGVGVSQPRGHTRGLCKDAAGGSLLLTSCVISPAPLSWWLPLGSVVLESASVGVAPSLLC